MCKCDVINGNQHSINYAQNAVALFEHQVCLSAHVAELEYDRESKGKGKIHIYRRL